MAIKRPSKYDDQQIEEIKEWIYHVLQQDAPEGDLLTILKDGSVLCELANAILPEKPIVYKKNQKMPFFQMETIEKFLLKAPVIGVPANEMFTTIDLYEKKDPNQVYTGLISLSRYANKLNPEIPTIGPKLSDKKPSNSPHKAKGNDYVYNSFEYSYIKNHKEDRGKRVVSGGSDIVRGAA